MVPEAYNGCPHLTTGACHAVDRCNAILVPDAFVPLDHLLVENSVDGQGSVSDLDGISNSGMAFESSRAVRLILELDSLVHFADLFGAVSADSLVSFTGVPA